MENNVTKASVKKIIGSGDYFILDEYALKEELISKINDAFFSGIEKLESRQCSDAVKTDGLASLHQHFPIQKVRLLEFHLMQELRDLLYYWTYRVAEKDLGILNEFFIDNLIVFRIHYPYELAKKAKGIIDPPTDYASKLRIATGDLKNKHMIAHRLNDFKRNKVGKWLGVFDNTNSYSPEEYHGDIPRPARSHGPHIDTWYGHSYDGINLWLAIDGVNADNTVILYPEMFGNPVDYDPVSMYIKAGNQLTKPVKHPMSPGQLLVFNPELLHGTQVNISDQTRVALTTRLNPDTPRFNTRASFHFQHWRSSKDLARKEYNKISIFPASQFTGSKSIPDQSATIIQRKIQVYCHSRLNDSQPVDVCASEELSTGEKMAVNLLDAHILVMRTKDGLKAMNRKCPHRGIDIIDGYHDDTQVFCPGHGIAFNPETGHSTCSAFKLKTYDAYDSDGRLFVSKATD